MTKDTESDTFSHLQPFLGIIASKPGPEPRKNIKPSCFSNSNFPFLFMQHFCIVLTNINFFTFRQYSNLDVSLLQVINTIYQVHGYIQNA